MPVFFQTDSLGEIVYQNNLPFHESWGMRMTEEELLEIGYLVESVPEPPHQEGKTVITIYKDGEFEFIYQENNVPIDDTHQRIEQLESDLGISLFESAMDKAKIANLETVQGEMLMEIAMLKMGGI